MAALCAQPDAPVGWHDLTERKAAEDFVGRERERLRDPGEAPESSFEMLDAGQRLIAYNRGFLGVAPPDAPPLPIVITLRRSIGRWHSSHQMSLLERTERSREQLTARVNEQLDRCKIEAEKLESRSAPICWSRRRDEGRGAAAKSPLQCQSKSLLAPA